MYTFTVIIMCWILLVCWIICAYPTTWVKCSWRFRQFLILSLESPTFLFYYVVWKLICDHKNYLEILIEFWLRTSIASLYGHWEKFVKQIWWSNHEREEGQSKYNDSECQKNNFISVSDVKLNFKELRIKWSYLFIGLTDRQWKYYSMKYCINSGFWINRKLFF